LEHIKIKELLELFFQQPVVGSANHCRIDGTDIGMSANWRNFTIDIALDITTLELAGRWSHPINHLALFGGEKLVWLSNY